MQPDQGIAALAAGQHGVFTRAQALASGFTDKAIAIRISKGTWTRVRKGLYAVAGTPQTFLKHAMGARLLTGSASAVSHRAAAYLHGLTREEPNLVDVSVLHGTHYQSRAGLIVHQVAALGSRDVRSVLGIPTTTATRTVVDLGGVLGPIELEQVHDDAVLRGLTSIAALRACIERVGPTRAGMGRLQRILDDREFGVPESELERLFLRLVARYGLPLPERQVPKQSGHSRVDFAYSQLGIFIELDGRKWHGSARAFRTDPRRQNSLVLDGMVPFRFTWHDLANEPDYVAETVRQALVMRSSESILSPGGR